jgi:hypothetical protein
VLTRAAASLLAAAALALTVAADARAQGDGDAVRRPERLTTGVSDQLLGQLAPDGRSLYFVSNRNTTSEIYKQDKQGSGAKILFDEGADVTWPRLSPDGKRILYISFRDDAAGLLCVRDLPDRKRRCLNGVGSAVQAQWIDGGHIALLTRGSVSGDLSVFVVDVRRRLSSRTLVNRNLTNPTVSPDGHWLVYVPVQRAFEQIGPGFAARAAPRLEAMRLDRPSEPPHPLAPDLPGLSGQPAFSVDGRALYFTQFLNDSNQDGEIDATDHGVLFRVPFEPDRDDAPARAATQLPTQLTDASWNCQYPTPAKSDLISSCTRGNGLDIYGLPLDGVVPSDWSGDRLQLEVDLAARPSEQLLLYRHLLARQTTVTGRRQVMMRLIRLHLASDEFDAADFYARKIKAVPDPETAGAATALRLLIEHRHARRDRERGRLATAWVTESRQRFDALSVEKTKAPAAIALRRLVRSEIADNLGDKDGARKELEAVPVADVKLPSFLEAYYERADALYRQLDDRDALWNACRRLSEHAALGPDDRLRYARAAVRALVRGLPFDEAEATLARARAEAPAGSELAFALQLGAAIGRVRSEDVPKPVRNALVDLYKEQTRHGRRRALVVDAVSRASQLDAEKLIEALAQLYVDDVPRGTQERVRAERLFDRVMLGRAYRRLSRGRLDKAREVFEKVVTTTGALEAHVGAIDLRLRAGETAEKLLASYGTRGGAGAGPNADTVAHFVRAYLLARELPSLSGDAHDAAVTKAEAELKAGGGRLRRQAPAQVVWGVVLHERFLREGALPAAQRANIHYLLALELTTRNPRYRALVLSQLALLQSQVGNWRIALGHLEEREKLPITDDVLGLGHRLLKARTLFHVDRETDAAGVADQAVALVERVPALAEYRVATLDRAALYNLAVGRFARALALYDAELPLLEGKDGDEAARNRVVARLARAGAALGAGEAQRALADLTFVDERLGDKRVQAQLRWAHTAPAAVLQSYRLIAAGLRANAHLRLGQLAAAERALAVRRTLAADRWKQSNLDEHLRALTLVEARLADVALDRRDGTEAVRWLKLALGHADDYVKKTGVPVHGDQLDLLRFAAELRLDPGLRQQGLKLQLNLGRRLRDAHDKLVKERDPAYREQQRWFEIYTALFGTKGQRRAALDAPANRPAADGAEPKAAPASAGPNPASAAPSAATNPAPAPASGESGPAPAPPSRETSPAPAPPSGETSAAPAASSAETNPAPAPPRAEVNPAPAAGSRATPAQ